MQEVTGREIHCNFSIKSTLYSGTGSTMPDGHSTT